MWTLEKRGLCEESARHKPLHSAHEDVLRRPRRALVRGRAPITRLECFAGVGELMTKPKPPKALDAIADVVPIALVIGLALLTGACADLPTAPSPLVNELHHALVCTETVPAFARCVVTE